MKNRPTIFKFYGVLILVLFSLLVILKAISWPEILTLALFTGCSFVPLSLLVIVRKRLRTPVVHWVVVLLMWFVAAIILGHIHFYDYPAIVILVAILPSILTITDLVLNDEIGRPPRKRFRALVQIAQVEVVFSFISLFVLGLFFDGAERFGATQYTLMFVTLVGMIYLMSTVEKYRDPIRAIAPLIVASTWNIAVAFYDFSFYHSGWSAPMFLAFGFLATAYKLGRCPVPDDWIEPSNTTERPTQGLKRTADAAA